MVFGTNPEMQLLCNYMCFVDYFRIADMKLTKRNR